jgi:hypothetical protein
MSGGAVAMPPSPEQAEMFTTTQTRRGSEHERD